MPSSAYQWTQIKRVRIRWTNPSSISSIWLEYGWNVTRYRWERQASTLTWYRPNNSVDLATGINVTWEILIDLNFDSTNWIISWSCAGVNFSKSGVSALINEINNCWVNKSNVWAHFSSWAWWNVQYIRKMEFTVV